MKLPLMFSRGTNGSGRRLRNETVIDNTHPTHLLSNPAIKGEDVSSFLDKFAQTDY